MQGLQQEACQATKHLIQVYALEFFHRTHAPQGGRINPSSPFLVQFLHQISTNPEKIPVCKTARLLQE
jgi:hypothetical protein